MGPVVYVLLFVWGLVWAGYDLSQLANGNYGWWICTGILVNLYIIGMCFVEYVACRFGRN